MKRKHLVIVSLILTILTLGAVSASDNITDDLAVEDATEEPIEVADDSAIEIADEQDGDVLADGAHDYSDEFISIDFYPVTAFDDSAPVMDIYFNDTSNIPDTYRNSTLVFLVNGSQKYSIDIADGMNVHETVYNYDLSIYKTDFGNHTITVNRLSPSGVYNLYTGIFHVSPVYVQVQSAYGRDHLAYGEPLEFYVALPNNAPHAVTVTLNGRTYNVNFRSYEGSVVVSSQGLGLGIHTAIVTFAGGGNYAPDTRQVKFLIEPKVSYPGAVNLFGDSFISLGEDESIEIIAPAGTSGVANLTLYDGYDIYDSRNLTVSNGYASYSLSGLPLGYYRLTIEGMVDNVGFSVSDDFVVDVNMGGYQIVIPDEITEGAYGSVFMDVPPTATVMLSVDGIPAKVYMMRGPIEDVIVGLAAGTHKIKVVVLDSSGSTRFSNTYTVTVKSKPVPVKEVIGMTLKKVKVKRSAKKLVLSATLKINGKLAKGKIIKFKFNKMTYSAKTSSKGVAKVTVKSSVLKKLKAGKKVTYTATYGKTVKKITVKVLR